MKNKKSTVLLLLVFALGLSLLLYPTVSDWWNSFHQSQAIASYAQAVADIDEDDYEQYLADARAYNQALPGRENRYRPTDEQTAEYERLLNITGNGIMGYVEIPTIDVTLPIYHGTSESVLQIAIGHIEGSSLPVGGEGTHCVISGHRGLPSARLFTDLDELVIGDVFMLRVLDETLTYEVDQIRVVEPQQLEDLEILPGEDLCTLVTCTPYGVNSHRLLVRGHRVATRADGTRVAADALQIDPMLVAPAVAAPILLVLLVGLLAGGRKKGPRNKGGGNSSSKGDPSSK